MEKTNDITKLKVAYAMRECMEKATVEDITVRKICEKGNFSRQTFYRCFSDKYDLINWYFDRILNESFKQMGKGTTIRESLVLKFRYIQQEQLFFRAAFSYDDQNNLTDHDFEMIFDFYKNNADKFSLTTLNLSGFMGPVTLYTCSIISPMLISGSAIPLKRIRII